MKEVETHQRESSEDTERHLQENIGKFETDCVYLLRLMLQGKRLTRKEVSKMDINERRLGDLHEAGKCEREWVMKANGSRSHVEYFVNVPHPPTKHEVIERSAKVINMMKSIPDKELITVFSLPDIPDEPKSYTQQNLFE